MKITRDLQIAIAIYTAGVERARREYRFHPFSQSCGRQHRCPNQLETKK